MTVQELINELQKVENKDNKVIIEVEKKGLMTNLDLQLSKIKINIKPDKVYLHGTVGQVRARLGEKIEGVFIDEM